MPADHSNPERRKFVVGAGAALSALLLPFGGTANAASSAPGAEPDEPWLKGLTGKHRQFFDIGAGRNGVPLERILNFYEAYKESYAVDARDLNVLFGFHGAGSAYVLNDAMYAKYALGKKYETTDPLTKATATRNPFVRMLPGYTWRGDYSIEAFQARGGRILWCNKSLGNLSRDLAKDTGGSEADIAAELRKNVLPGITIVPAMVVASNRAQEAGCAYSCIA
ncbi:MAG: hypothetical protein ABJE47_21670 [bacterium]